MAGGESGEGERDWRGGPPPRAESAFLSTRRGPLSARPRLVLPLPRCCRPRFLPGSGTVKVQPRTPPPLGGERPWVEAHRSRSQGATTSHSAIFARIFSRGIAMGRSGVTGMACLPSLIGMRGRCAVVEEQDCWLLVVTRCVAGRVALTRQAVVVGLLPRRLDRRTFEPSYHVLRRFRRR